jgi:hypothetical protein
MEYVDGLDLRRVVTVKGPLLVGHACNFAYQAALGLQHAHEQGMIHRDIKPSNMMLSHDRGRAVIKLLDFGLARATREEGGIKLDFAERTQHGDLGNTLTRVGQMLGTPDFIAPEQILDAQQADVRSDIYSLGCTLYCLLSGQPPFQEMTLADVLEAHKSVDATPLNNVRGDVPPELAALVARMMAKEPGRRFQRAADVAEALAPFFKKSAAAITNKGPGTSAPVSKAAGHCPVEGQQIALSGDPGYELLSEVPDPSKEPMPRASAGRVVDRKRAEMNQPVPPRPGLAAPSAADPPPADGEHLPFHRSPIFVAVILISLAAVASYGVVAWTSGRSNSVGGAEGNATGGRVLSASQETSGASILARSQPGAATEKTPAELAGLWSNKTTRKIAPEIETIEDVAVSVATATVGPIDQLPKGNYLCLVLRITNLSQKPVPHQSWRQPEIAVILRDQNGGYYNRIKMPVEGERSIKPNGTIEEKLLFEATPAGVYLDLDLPVAGGAQSYQFRIPFAQRPDTVTPPSKPALASPPAPSAALKAEKKAAPAQPPYDPEKDPKLTARLKSEYRKGQLAIQRAAMGMGSNDAARHRRNAPKDLLKSLAKQHDLKLEQVRRIVGVD